MVVVDENPAPDNVLTAFGLSARNDFFQVVRGDRSLAQVALPVAPLVRVVPAARAARELDHMTPVARQRLIAGFRAIQEGAGYVLIDCAGSRRIGHVSTVAALARHFVVVVAAHGAAITHAYALIKRIHQEHGRESFQIVVTRARSPEEARAIFDNMRRVAREHLGVRLDYLGGSAVPVTDHLADALIRNLPPSMESVEMGGFLPSSIAAPRRSGISDSVL